MSTTVEPKLWSGVAEVIPTQGNDLLGGANGAYVGVVGIAKSEKEFILNASAAFLAMDFDMLELTEIELIPSLERWTNADESMRERCAALSLENPIAFGAFHCFTA